MTDPLKPSSIEDTYNSACERQEQRAFELARELVEIRFAKEQAEALLKELADDLEAWVENHYQYTKDHGLRRQYERDMEPVHRARALLSAMVRDK